MKITFKTDLQSVDWDEVKTRVAEDDFDNGRTPDQLKASFENSYATCLAFADDQIVGKARALSDGVCNAYIVDVWTYTPYRHQGIGRSLVKRVMIGAYALEVPTLYLYTPDRQKFYEHMGWSVLERTEYKGEEITIMSIEYPFGVNSHSTGIR